MMKTTLTLLLMCITLCLFAQEELAIRLNKSQASSDDKLCLDIELKSVTAEKLRIAGQNYRLLYNVGQFDFAPNSLQTYLSQKAYSEWNVELESQNGVGILSLSTSGKSRGPEVLEVNPQAWYRTASFCLTPKMGGAHEVYWANPDTKELATADVSVTLWREDGGIEPAKINTMHGYHSTSVASDNTSSLQVDENNFKIFPNPVSDYLNIALNYNVQSALYTQIYDLNGALVARADISKPKGVHSMMVQDLASGQYYFEIADNEGKLIDAGRFVKL